jgi:predicted DCC family thiol-disulfide oxidoreductase YuxK
MKPLLVYDGDCGFCLEWIARWRVATGDRVDYAPYQEFAARFPEIPRERFAQAVQLHEPDGRWSSGAEAVLRALSYARGRGWLLWLYRRMPGFAPVSELAYRFVAGHRPTLLRVTRWVWGAHVVPPGERLTAWIAIRLLALVYLAAFVSAWLQMPGLAGSHGILPAADYLRALHARYGSLALWAAPTLGWISASDGFLLALCGAGALLSVLLAVGAAPIVCLALLWLLYLSISILGQDFFWFQWDSLLLEAGLLALFLAPWRWWSNPRSDPPPRQAGLWLSRWLLSRLSMSSAAVKLLSGDPTWHAGTALQYHFETQPLPPWTAWYVHHLPAGVLRAATFGTIAIEGLAPQLLFAPRRIRFLGAGLIASLQILILITGNYGFFNWLTLALCVLCLDDGVWPKRWRPRAPEPGTSPSSGRRGAWTRWTVRALALLCYLLSLVPFLHTLQKPTKWLGPVNSAFNLVWPFRSFNQYGLFAVMTTRRVEIVVEGSDDGAHWLPYEFRYKPGDPMREPPFVAPHQPRLDWQMWFAALSDFRQQPWFLLFCKGLLEGSRPVTALLAANPFPRAPPKYLRALAYEYHFTDPAGRKRTGAWWRRQVAGLYCPILTLENGQLAAVGGAPR